MGDRFHGMARRAEGSGLNRGVHCGAPIPRSQPCHKGDDGAHRVYERFVYAEDGGFLTGSFPDYPVPTASMIPELEILHRESPSPVTPLGAKSVAEGVR